jgi:hypothetical protein
MPEGLLQRVFDKSASTVSRFEASIRKDVRDELDKSDLHSIFSLAFLRAQGKLILMAPCLAVCIATESVAGIAGSPLDTSSLKGFY